MVEVNWHSFQSKFGTDSPNAFERLCYCIFCRMYGMTYGISRCRNHPSLETFPIVSNRELIGFQSKFFLDKFSEHKDDVRVSIENVGKRYSGLKRLVYFMPMDHDFNPRAKNEDIATRAQKEVESLAGKYGFSIEWFCHSNFEALFSNKQYDDIGRYFFTNDRGVLDLYEALDECTKQFLLKTHDEFSFGGKTFKLNRCEVVTRILEQDMGSVYVLHGDGGVGKSAVVKELVKNVDVS